MDSLTTNINNFIQDFRILLTVFAFLSLLSFGFFYIVPTFRLLSLSLYYNKPFFWLSSLRDIIFLWWALFDQKLLLKRARNQIEAKLLNSQFSSQKDDEKPIEVKTCFDIYSVQEDIMRYFEALTRIDKEIKTEFLSEVSIETGFVAPLYLITGLLPRYENDWKPVIRNYGKIMADKNDRLHKKELRKLQTFLFDCWLLWGPSIPLCSCEQWQGKVALQFGYGDENNSIMLLCQQHQEILKNLLKQKEGEFKLLAAQISVKGKLKQGTELNPNEICSAQKKIYASDSLYLVLELSSDRLNPRGGQLQEVCATYYSAYLWVIFVICTNEGQPIYPEQKWLELLPFFEHGNIADESTYLLLKKQLVFKALSTIQEISGVLKNQNLKLHYACAIDDSNCGNNLLYPPLKNESIIFLIEDKLKCSHFKKLNDSERLVFKKENVGNKIKTNYSACHLPEILEDYYSSLSKQK